MYTDSQKPLKLHSLACMVLLLVALALAGCSASRPPLPALTDEATATSGPTPEASDTSSDTVLIMLTGFTLDESLKIERFLNEYCSREEEELPKPIKNVRRMLYEEYPLCGTAKVSDLEQYLRAMLKESGVEGVGLASEGNILIVAKRHEVPIFSPIQVKLRVKGEFVGQTRETLKKCEETDELRRFRKDSWWAYTEVSGYDPERTIDDVGIGRQCSVAFPTKVLDIPTSSLSECVQHACETPFPGVLYKPIFDSTFTCPEGSTYRDYYSHVKLLQGFEFDPPKEGQTLIDFCWHPTGIDKSDCLGLRYPCN